ncbi:hypothetical protein ACROYT_G041869 [Oculina patagonica]
MVCDKCQKKLGKVICPDPWKSGARNTTEGGGRRVNENKLLTQKKNSLSLSVIVRENRAGAKHRGRPFTVIFLHYKSYLIRLATVAFAAVEVLFSSR